MKSHDVIIVGAGPAGSTCAARLKQAGLDVGLFDKKSFPRVKPCAGWVTPQVIEELNIDVGDYCQNHVFQPVTGFRTGMIGHRLVETCYPQPVSYGILRVEFDHYLLQRCGVVVQQVSVHTITRHKNLWQVQDAVAPLLVGAGGHFCPVGRLARNLDGPAQADPHCASNGKSDVPNVVYAQEVEFRMSGRQRSADLVDPQKPELYFCPDLSGYGWCFRKGDYLNIGMGRLNKTGLGEHVQEFCKYLRRQNKLVDEIPAHFLGHAYRIYADVKPKLFDDGLILIGDAAGLAYPQSGEGIRPAVESALLAADVISQAAGDYRAASLAAYEQRLTARLGMPQPHQRVPWLPAAWLQAVATRLMATRWFARNMIIDSWFLRRHLEPLAIEGGRRPCSVSEVC